MILGVELPRTGAEWMMHAGWLFVAAKLIATALQAVLLRGDYSRRPDTVLCQVMYVAGKVTPSLAMACFSAASFLDGDHRTGWEYVVFAVALAVLAAGVVRLRQLGRFYGVAHLLSKRNS